MKIIIITVLLIVVAVVITVLYMNRSTITKLEKFDPNEGDPDNLCYQELRFMGKRTSDCYKLDKRDCMKYDNCGLCLEDGKMQCVPGDVDGPFYKETCDHWMHTDSFDRHIFGERVTTISPPWSKFYPDYETKWPSPVAVSALQ